LDDALLSPFIFKCELVPSSGLSRFRQLFDALEPPAECALTRRDLVDKSFHQGFRATRKEGLLIIVWQKFDPPS
jgi:hypothetical protein